MKLSSSIKSQFADWTYSGRPLIGCKFADRPNRGEQQIVVCQGDAPLISKPSCIKHHQRIAGKTTQQGTVGKQRMKKNSALLLALLAPSVSAQKNQDELIDRLGKDTFHMLIGDEGKTHALSVMKRVDRAPYCGCQRTDRGKWKGCTCETPYRDAPGPLGIAGQTISAPHMVGDGSVIIGIDNNEEIVNYARSNIEAERPTALKGNAKKRIELYHYNGTDGYPPGKPYDVIHVGAATPSSVIERFKEQLKEGGIIVVPFKTKGKTIMQVYQKQHNGEVLLVKSELDVRYVELTDQQ